MADGHPAEPPQGHGLGVSHGVKADVPAVFGEAPGSEVKSQAGGGQGLELGGHRCRHRVARSIVEVVGKRELGIPWKPEMISGDGESHHHGATGFSELRRRRDLGALHRHRDQDVREVFGPPRDPREEVGASLVVLPKREAPPLAHEGIAQLLEEEVARTLTPHREAGVGSPERGEAWRNPASGPRHPAGGGA